MSVEGAGRAPGGPIEWTGYSDGTAAPNPGPMGIGVVLHGPDGARIAFGRRLGVGCNTEAEARALLAALACAREHGIDALCMYSDSVEVLEHVRGNEHTKVARLDAVYTEIQARLGDFAAIALRWAPRAQVGAADALARDAVGLAPRPAHRVRTRRRGR